MFKDFIKRKYWKVIKENHLINMEIQKKM